MSTARVSSPNGHVDHDDDPAVGGRVPPHNLEAEVAVLGSLLIEGANAYQRVVDEGLEAEHFYPENHAAIFRGAASLFRDGEPIDNVTLAAELEKMGVLERVGGRALLGMLQEQTPTSANCAHYARTVRDLAQKRRLIKTGGDVVALGFDEAVEAGEAVQKAQEAVFALDRPDAEQTWADAQQLVGEALETLKRRESGETIGLRTGFRKLDELLCGLRSGEVVIIAGRPAMGKTAVATQVAVNVAREGVPVAVVSLEMSRSQLTERILCSEARIDSQRLARAMLGDDEHQRLHDAADLIGRLPLIIDAPAVIDEVGLRDHARRLKRSKGIGLVVVDYVQLIRRRGRSEGLVNDMTVVSLSLKALARELDVPVIALSQLSRGVEQRDDKRPEMSDLRQSGGLEQDAAAVVMLYRDEYYHREKSQKPGICELLVRKNRFGPEGVAEYFFERQYAHFAELVRRGAPVDLDETA